MQNLARLARFAEDQEVADAFTDELKEADNAKKVAERTVLPPRNRLLPLPHITADPQSRANSGERVAAWLDPQAPQKPMPMLEEPDITVWARRRTARDRVLIVARYMRREHPCRCPCSGLTSIPSQRS